MTLKSRRIVFWSGIVLGMGGFFLLRWSRKVFDDLTNYQRLAVLLPLMYSLPMVHVDTLDDWAHASTLRRIRAVGAVIMPLLLTIGCLMWLILAPDARATN